MAAFDNQSGLTGVVTRTVGAAAPAAVYSAWATELGVSATTSLYAMDADDTAYEIELAAPALGSTNTTAFFSSEGGLGLYPDRPVQRINGVVTSWFDSSEVSRMYAFLQRPIAFFTFHPQRDNRSLDVKLQRSGTTTIITGRIRDYSAAIYAIDFAIRLNGNSTWQFVFAAIDQPINFFLFGWDTINEAIRETLPVGEIVNLDLTDLIYTPRPLASWLPTSGSSTEYLTGPDYSGTRYLTPHYGAKDFNYGGQGVISGTVKLDGTPTDVPVSRRVRLFREQDGVLIREQWSAAGTGAYSFPGIQEGIAYTVISYDHTHNFRAVIADNIIPDLMP